MFDALDYIFSYFADWFLIACLFKTHYSVLEQELPQITGSDLSQDFSTSAHLPLLLPNSQEPTTTLSLILLF